MRIGGGPLAATTAPRVRETTRPVAQDQELPAELDTLEEEAEPAPSETAEPPPGARANCAAEAHTRSTVRHGRYGRLTPT